MLVRHIRYEGRGHAPGKYKITQQLGGILNLPQKGRVQQVENPRRADTHAILQVLVQIVLFYKCDTIASLLKNSKNIEWEKQWKSLENFY